MTAKKATARRATKKAAAAKATAKKSPADASSPRRARRGLPDPVDVERPWLASYPPGVPESYEHPLVPLTRLLDDAAKDFPDTLAVEFLGYTLTYRELLDQVDRFGTALRELGLGKGDRVGIILPNCPQHVVALYAAWRLGAVVAEASPLLNEDELERRLNDAGCRVVVCLDPAYRLLARLKGRLTTVEHIVATSIGDALPFPGNMVFPLTGRRDGTYYRIPPSDGVKRMTELIARAAPTVGQTPLDPSRDLAALLYTGGTTGPSRAAMLTHENLVANAFQARLWIPDIQAGRENVLCAMPFSHAFGMTMCLGLGILSAATLTLLPRFDRDAALRTIDKRKPTLLPGIPEIFVALNDAPDVRRHDLSSVRVSISGAAPLPAGATRTFEELTGGKLRESYGVVEASPLTHANPIYGRAKQGSIGLPVTDTVCLLLDLDDPTRTAPPGGPGELALAGPQVMSGYWIRPDETAQVLRDGWLRTGDVATMDGDGYVTFVARAGRPRKGARVG